MIILNRTFLISGGASGLGLATAHALHSRGAYVALLDLNADAGAAAVRALSETGNGGDNASPRAQSFEVDVADTESIKTAVESTAKWVKQTGKEIGGVVAAAGTGMPGLIVDKHNEPVPLESLDFVLSINIRGTLDLIRQTLPYMTHNTRLYPDGERGVLILVSSVAAFDGQMGQTAYAASKGAVASAALPLARDLSKYGIRALAIAPGFFESNMTAQVGKNVRKGLEKVMEFPTRAGKADEFAKLVVECVENSMLNGTVLRLDGALRMPSRL